MSRGFESMPCRSESMPFPLFLALVYLRPRRTFASAIPVITVLEQLSEKDMCRILTEPKNSIIKQYQRIMEMDGIELTFTDEALEEIARETLKRNSGARGLRSVLEKLLIPVMYDVSSRDGVKAVTFDLEGVRTGVPQVS